ncbi:uncharacterized protein LOC120479865 [Pimephales promelas]|uniref:uncharacterized protein LOC120479865 n=1 Tax=Pimephales promelas TaxID=90988 RepID=UPI001955D78A|nr:uncharacterized protein LOC120479865 [Pimephales promelas]
MSMREAGLHVQPNISRCSVASIVRTFREENRIERLPHAGGRRGMFSQQQETIIVNMVLQNNLIRLREIKQRVEEDNENFEGINSVSLSTIDRVLKRNLISLKQAYRGPFERNSERVKELRYQYVQRMFQLDSIERPHECIFLDEAGFNLAKRRRRGRNIIGQRAIVEWWQRDHMCCHQQLRGHSPPYDFGTLQHCPSYYVSVCSTGSITET